MSGVTRNVLPNTFSHLACGPFAAEVITETVRRLGRDETVFGMREAFADGGSAKAQDCLAIAPRNRVRHASQLEAAAGEQDSPVGVGPLLVAHLFFPATDDEERMLARRAG